MQLKRDEFAIQRATRSAFLGYRESDSNLWTPVKADSDSYGSFHSSENLDSSFDILLLIRLVLLVCLHLYHPTSLYADALRAA